MAGATSGPERQKGAPLPLPMSFGEIVHEIVSFTDLSREEVEQRVWMQALEPGSNVLEDVLRFGVTPHEHDENMDRLYRDGNGFIFETMVFWAKPMRNPWTHDALHRIRLYAERIGRSAGEVEILVLGDGAGNDSLFLAAHGYRVHYFDVPGSKTYDFAMRRFDHYGLLGGAIHPMADYASCLQREYDVVVCFEVLEHLPEPLQVIREIGTMLRPQGIALITDDFGDLSPHLPTHLRASAHLEGRTPFLFLAHGMVLTWYGRALLFKPMEFEKVERIGPAERWSLWRDAQVRGALLAGPVSRLTRLLEKLPHLGP